MISFLICAFNEEKNIKNTIKTLYDSIDKVKFIDKFEIIVINDGSTDLTEKNILDLQLNDKNIIYYKNEKNLGLGKSIKKGVTKIKYPKFMMIPGDNDLSSQAISSALKHVNSVDLLMLFPVNFDNRSKIRNIVSHIYRIIYLIFFDTYVHYINGPSIFPTENVKNLKLYSSRFSIISEMITKLLHSEITYCEIPFFFEAKSRKRNTISMSNLINAIFSFIQIFIEMKIMKRNKYLGKSKRKNLY